MEILTIPVKYKNKKLIPLNSLPDNVDTDGIVILFKQEQKKDPKGLLNIKPLRLGLLKSKISRENAYSE